MTLCLHLIDKSEILNFYHNLMESYKEKNIIESTLKHLESESVAIAMRINTTVRASMSKKIEMDGFHGNPSRDIFNGN